MPTYAKVPVVGPYDVIQDPGGTTTYSTTDLLADDSEATYVEVDQYIGPAGVLYNRVRGNLATGGTAVETRPALRVFGRVKADGPLQYIRLDTVGGGSSSYWALEDGIEPIPSPVGLLYPMDDAGLGVMNNAIRGLAVTATAAVTPTRDVSHIVRISEFWIVAMVLSTIAPPCRNIKRGDVLDLGGARNYPPSKMQQTSSRGVGAY